VIGMISGFRQIGWEVKPFIAGDRLPRRLTGRGSEAAVAKSLPRQLVADVARLGLALTNSRRALRELGGEVDWVYERLALMHALGRPFQERGVPWVLETQSLYHREAAEVFSTLRLVRLARAIELTAYRRADVIVAVSGRLKDVIVAEACVPPDKILVVPNGVDVALFDPGRYSRHGEEDELVIGFVGEMAPWQGLDLLLEAIARARVAGMPCRAHLVGDGAFRAQLEGLARRLGLTDWVRFVDTVPREEVPAQIARFDVGFSGHSDIPGAPAYHSPLKLYEYMAMAKPVLTTRTEDAMRLVEEGRTGFFFDAHDPDSLLAALRRAHEARHRLGRMGEEARAVVVREHTWAARAQAVVEGVRAVLQGRHAP
jgi:glycosyltransferase involved in cell wall biosynthesis